MTPKGASIPPETPVLSVEDLRVERQGQLVLEIERFAVQAGETLAIIGPNGAGKTTLLLALAQLIRPSSGAVFFHGQQITPANQLAVRRRMALVLQHPLLMQTSVFNNVASGLRFRGLPRAEVEQRTTAWLERLGISSLRSRPAQRLSGGEAQRASLARAMAIQPEVLMLDEPFSALDAPTRARLLSDLKALLDTPPSPVAGKGPGNAMTTLFVTHDLDEALLLGGRVAVLIGGRLRQVGPPERVFSAPTDREVAGFVGVETVIPGQILSSQDGLAVVQSAAGLLEGLSVEQAGTPVFLCLRPEDITVQPAAAGLQPASGPLPGGYQPTSARNHVTGRITRATPQGPLVRLVIDAGCDLVALVTRSSAQELGLIAGQAVIASFKASAVHLISRPMLPGPHQSEC